ncbi:MAG: hypothetical protein ACRDSL_04390 [Pseudonocardiaceae bacterium]
MDDDGNGAPAGGSGGEGGSGGSGSAGGNGGAGGGGNSLDAILEKLDEDGRKAVRGELERARGDAAKYRTRANKFGDMDPDKAKAALAKLDEIEVAGKTEAQQAAERAAAAEQDRDTARRDLWRERAGRTHKLSDVFTAMLVGDTEEAVTEHARKIAEELDAVGSRPGDAVPRTPTSKTSPGAGPSDQFDAAKIAEQAISRM